MFYGKNQRDGRERNSFTGIRRGFFGVIVAAFVFNMFFAGFLNITSEVKRLKNGNFIMAELQNNLSQSKKGELEKKFLNLEEVQKVTYVDSYVAFQELQKNLGIVIPRGENPLPDTLRIYFNDAKDVEKLQGILEETQEIKEFFVDGTYISEINGRVRVLNLFGIAAVLGAVFSLFLINTLFLFQVEDDYMINMIADRENPRNRIKAKNINLLPFTIGILVSQLLFFNFYVIIRKALINEGIFADVLSLFQIIYFQGGAAFLIILFVWFMPVDKRTGARR